MSFLITTPETWVPALGDTESGFPYLSAAGRLVIKDVIMMGASMVPDLNIPAIILVCAKVIICIFSLGSLFHVLNTGFS